MFTTSLGTPFDDATKESTARGLDYLQKAKPELIEFRLPFGSWNLALPTNKASKTLDDRVAQGLDDNGNACTFALKNVLASAQKQLGYKLTLVEHMDPNKPTKVKDAIATFALSKS